MFRIVFLSMMLLMFTQEIILAETSAVDSYTAQEMMSFGKDMYRQGILPSGEPIQAMVATDIPVDGDMFTCVNCHQRSGLGSVEGSVITWPINGKELFTPRRQTGAWHAAKQEQGPGARQRWSLPSQYQAADNRPAYTDETLARLLREGIAPDGRVLNRAMPRYQINDSDMAILSHYLKNLSIENDPGVDENSIRFATVVTQGVSEVDKDAMLSVLQAHININNTQTRPHQRRARSGPFYKTEKFGAYRLFELDVWELSGPPDTWQAQLEAYYQAGPVFAMLGGITSGSWAPIHHFCEEREIPCIFPVTDQPVVSDSDWYTLYFSKGLYQEGEAAVRYLRTTLDNRPNDIVQVYRTASDGAVLAQGVRENLRTSADITLTEKTLSIDEALTDKLLQEIFETQQAAAILLWLDNTDIKTATQWLAKEGFSKERSSKESLSKIPQSSTAIFVSWGLLDENASAISKQLRDMVYFTYPRDLPEDNKLKMKVLKHWLKLRKIPVTNLDIQSQMYFLGWMLPGAVSHMRSEFFRDYFMESFDMMQDQDYAIAAFPRLTFGPGQRYASKGCYVVQLDKGEQAELIRKSEWIIH